MCTRVDSGGGPLSWLTRAREQARARIAAARDETAPYRPPVGPVEAEPTAAEQSIDEGVPRGVRTAAAWAWRFLVLAAAAYLLVWALARLRVVVIPLAIALLLAALLQPSVTALRNRGVPRALAAAVVLVGGLAAVAGVLTAVVNAFINGVPDLVDQVSEGIDEIRVWLADGPLHVSQEQIDKQLTDVREAISENRGELTSGALNTAVTIGEVVAGFFLVLLALFFFLKDGDVIWGFLTGVLPRGAGPAVHEAGRHAWRTLVAYVRATVFVAFVDALGIGLGAHFVGLPLVLPLAALVFLASFIPLVGATLSGVVAVMVALVAQGPLSALVMLLIVIGVQQLEGHVLQPLVMGRAVSVHPLAVILGIASGAVLSGIVGALVAVPIIATANTAVRYLVARPGGGSAEADEPPGTGAPGDDSADTAAAPDQQDAGTGQAR